MPTIRTLTPDQFARVSNNAVDTMPSVLAIGYLTILMRHEDGWVPSVDKMVGKYVEGETSLTKARRTLRDEGYYIRVKFQYDGGKHHTDIWRASEPHSNDALDQIASYYVPGSVWQIPQVDKRGKHVRDARGHTVMRPVTVRWAQMESWRALEERITGEEPAEDTPAETDDVSPGHTDPPNSGGRESDTETNDVSAGRTDPPHTEGRHTEGSAHRGVGNRGVQEKTSQNTSEETSEETKEPFGDTQKVPNLQKVYGGNAGRSANGSPKQSNQVGDHLTAHARGKAGPAACQALDENPSITQAELAAVIRQENPALTRAQAVGRAASLLSFSIMDDDSARPGASHAL